MGGRLHAGTHLPIAKQRLLDALADFQVASDIAIRCHQVLVNCAFSFCWDAWLAHPAP
jgi:hypothetical protein